jgi:putative phosphoribosyl transferase
MELPYADRREAGRELGALLRDSGQRADLVLGLPRGGVPVAYEVAAALGCPLDVLVVRKLGHPGQHEFAIGAIASGGVRILSEDAAGIPADTLESITRREAAELLRREQLYRGGHPPLDVAGRRVIVVDDGLATGASMRAAVAALREASAAQITVAAPVGASETCAGLQSDADAVICVATPEPFYAVGLWYQNFTATTEDEVTRLLDAARSGASHLA